jgi:hypothetical protein
MKRCWWYWRRWRPFLWQWVLLTEVIWKVIILRVMYRNPASISDCTGTVETYLSLSTMFQILISPNICPPPPRQPVYFSWNATSLCNFEVCLNARPEGTDFATKTPPHAFSIFSRSLGTYLVYTDRNSRISTTWVEANFNRHIHGCAPPPSPPPPGTHLYHIFWKRRLNTHLHALS